jgi:chemotaxis response regulator CheB
LRPARKLLTAVMDRPNIVVIGVSAGALEPLQKVVASLPEKWAIAVFVVIHTWPDALGALVPLLARAGSLRVKSAQDLDPIMRGTLLVAPPDQHLIIKDGFVRVTRSPRENLWHSSSAIRHPAIFHTMRRKRAGPLSAAATGPRSTSTCSASSSVAVIGFRIGLTDADRMLLLLEARLSH